MKEKNRFILKSLNVTYAYIYVCVCVSGGRMFIPSKN